MAFCALHRGPRFIPAFICVGLLLSAVSVAAPPAKQSLPTAEPNLLGRLLLPSAPSAWHSSIFPWFLADWDKALRERPWLAAIGAVFLVGWAITAVFNRLGLASPACPHCNRRGVDAVPKAGWQTAEALLGASAPGPAGERLAMYRCRRCKSFFWASTEGKLGTVTYFRDAAEVLW